MRLFPEGCVLTEIRLGMARLRMIDCINQVVSIMRIVCHRTWILPEGEPALFRSHLFIERLRNDIHSDLCESSLN